jgi:hypothetical protein
MAETGKTILITLSKDNEEYLNKRKSEIGAPFAATIRLALEEFALKYPNKK